MKKGIVLVSLFLLLSFFFFSRAVRNGSLKDFDFASTVKIQEKIDKSTRLRTAAFIGNVLEGSTFAASPEFSVAIVFILSLLYLKKYKFYGLLIPVLFGLLILGEMYGKTVVHHPAPPFSFIKNPITMFPPEYINDEYSYPSGHAARAVFMSIVICSWFIVRGKKIKYLVICLLGLYIVLVSVSRIYLGHHWLSDIIGGWLLGGGLGSVVFIKNFPLRLHVSHTSAGHTV